ncbi:MAG: chemotaxis protein CheW [Sedimenticolaceae bacterium]
MTGVDGEIRCMLIPLRAGRLLLPNAAVAEVIGYREPDPSAQGLAWLQGKVSWHQREIPVIDFERLLGRPHLGAGIRQRIAVCYAPDPEAGWPMLGLVAQGIPRLLRIGRESIDLARVRKVGEEAIQMVLSVAGEELLVPDLEYLQARLPAA